MKPSVLITGSTDFVFTNFIRQAFHLKQFSGIVSIDTVQQSKAINDLYVNKNHDFYPGSILDQHFVNTIFEMYKPDIVLHSTDDSIQINACGTQNIIDACKKYGTKKIIYYSTTDLIAPKLCAEILIQASGIPYCITRTVQAYGPRQDIDEFIPQCINSILQNKKTIIQVDGMQSKNWIHIYDVCSALFAIINNKEFYSNNNEMYYISSEQELSYIEVFQRICNVMQSGYDLLEFKTKKEENILDKYNPETMCVPQSLGYKSEYKFNLGVEHTIDWYLKNKWFFNL